MPAIRTIAYANLLQEKPFSYRPSLIVHVLHFMWAFISRDAGDALVLPNRCALFNFSFQTK